MRILADRKTSPFASIIFFRFCPFVTKLFLFLGRTHSFSFFVEETVDPLSVLFLLVPDAGAFFVVEGFEGSNVLNGIDGGGTPGPRTHGLGGW